MSSYLNFEEEEPGYTQTVPKKPATEGPKNTIFPITCLGLNSLQTNSKKMNLFRDIPIYYPSVCGRVVEIQKSNELIKYLIDDSTGYFWVGQFSNDEEESSNVIETNDIVKVIGKIKNYSQDKFLLIDKIIKVDMNQLLAHLIECAYAVKVHEK